MLTAYAVVYASSARGPKNSRPEPLALTGSNGGSSGPVPPPFMVIAPAFRRLATSMFSGFLVRALALNQ